MPEKLLFQVIIESGEYDTVVPSSSVSSISGKKELADYLRRCADRIEHSEWPFGNNFPTILLHGTA